MKSSFTFLSFCFLLLIAAEQVSAQTKPKPATSEVLDNKMIIELHKAGLGDDVVLAKIAASPGKYDLSTDGLIQLRKQGVSSQVIKALMEKNSGKETEASPATPKPDKAGFAAAELMNHVYVYFKSRQSAKALEKSVAGLRTKQGVFGGSVMLQVDGAKSSIRLQEDEATLFIINTGGAALPELILYRLKSVKDKREVASMKLNTFTGMKTGEDVIPIDITRIGDGIYQIAPNRKLEKGEYFFTGKPVANANSMDAYAFGVE